MRKVIFSCLLVIIQTIGFANQTGWINIKELGAASDGKTLITDIIRDAINKTSLNGGGTVYFPAGEYLTGPILLKSNTTIFIDAGATIRFSDNYDDYLPFVKIRWEGVVMNSFHPLFYAYEAENITITGRGKIDGQGKKWWDEHMANVTLFRNNPGHKADNKWQKLWEENNKEIKVSEYYKGTLQYKFFRPPFIQPYKCKNVRIEGITIENSPFWTVNPEFCDNVTVHGITIFNPESPNTDGINPESCSNVHISDCHISVGDDCITIKSGRDEEGRKYNVPCENITITNCTMLRGHGGVVIGSEMSGSVRKITISNCIFDGTDRGIRLKTMRGRGGVVEEIRVSNIVMKNIRLEGFTFDMHYGETAESPVTEETPVFRNIHISNVTGTQINKACNMTGIKEMPVNNITFNNINMEANLGFIIQTAKNIELLNVEVSAKNGPSFSISDASFITIGNIKSLQPVKGIPVLEINNSSNMFIYNCFPATGTDIFLKADGIASANIVLANNNFTHVKTSIIKGNNLGPGALVVKNQER